MATKKINVNKDSLVSMYMNYRLENSKKPESVYQFAKENGFEESEFYPFFGTLESIENEIYSLFIFKTKEILEKDVAYPDYDMQGKLLSFYFTLFEMMTANRSYILLTLNEHKNQLKNLSQLSTMRDAFKNYVTDIITDEVRTQFDKFQNFQEKAIQESTWLQFLLITKFWMDDNSANFEKTDLFIEKSVKAVFELFDSKPLESVIDFGKFLFKEKMRK